MGTLATAELLASSLASHSQWSEEEVVREWICETRQAEFSNDDTELMESVLNYGKALLKTKILTTSRSWMLAIVIPKLYMKTKDSTRRNPSYEMFGKHGRKS
jgi:hypothetical protein